jgi:hypothetical protein
MATIYTFPVIYTKAGIATVPSSAPTVQIVDSSNNILVAALTATTAITNMPGAYYYSYSGTDNLICWALFHTTDATVDQQDIASYTPTQIYTINNSITGIGGDYARRTGDYSTLTAGAQMDLIDSLKNKTGATGFDRTTDSLEAIGEGGGGTYIGTDGKVLISTDAQDLSSSLDVNAKKLAGTTPNNLAAGAQMDLIDAPNATAITAFATRVWNITTRTLTTIAGLGADVWAYTTRTLTQFLQAPNADTVSFYNYATNTITIANITDQTQIWFTVKKSRFDTDAESIVQIAKTGGLLYLNQAALVSPITSTDGSLSVVSGSLVVVLSAAASALLQPTAVLYGDVKVKTSAGVVSVTYQFDASVIQTVTRAVS